MATTQKRKPSYIAVLPAEVLADCIEGACGLNRTKASSYDSEGFLSQQQQYELYMDWETLVEGRVVMLRSLRRFGTAWVLAVSIVVQRYFERESRAFIPYTPDAGGNSGVASGATILADPFGSMDEGSSGAEGTKDGAKDQDAGSADLQLCYAQEVERLRIQAGAEDYGKPLQWRPEEKTPKSLLRLALISAPHWSDTLRSLIQCIGGFTVSRQMVDRVVENFTFLNRLELSSPVVGNGDMITLRSLPCLAHLSLKHCMNVTDQGLAALAPRVPKPLIDTIRFLNPESEAYQRALGGIPESLLTPPLVSLDLTGCHRVTDAGVQSIALMWRLQTLVLFDALKVGDAGIATVSRELPRLLSLNLRRVRFGQAGLQDLASNAALGRQGLVHLSLRQCSRIPPEAFITFLTEAQLPTLKWLDVGFTTQLLESKLFLKLGSAAKCMPGLLHLDISGAALRRDSVRALVSFFPNLTSLTVKEGKFFASNRDPGWEWAEFGSFHQLAGLVLDSSTGLSIQAALPSAAGGAVGMQRLASNLKHLSLRCCDLYDAFFPTLALLTSLETLDVSQCSSLRLSEVARLGVLPHLNTFRVAGVQLLTPEILDGIGHLRSLTTLDMSSCWSLNTGSGVYVGTEPLSVGGAAPRPIFLALPLLEHVDVSYNEYFWSGNPTLLERMARRLPALKSVRVRGVKNSILAYLRDQVPNVYFTI